MSETDEKRGAFPGRKRKILVKITSPDPKGCTSTYPVATFVDDEEADRFAEYLNRLQDIELSTSGKALK